MKNPCRFFILFGLTILFMGSCSREPVTPEKPNILFCIADDASYELFRGAETPWIRTPAIDRIAEQGLVFQNAYTPNAKCSPSRACILTGRNSWQLEEAGNHVPFFPAHFKTFAEALDDNGYHVGYTGKGWAPGVARWTDGSPRDLLVNLYDDRKTDPPAKYISTTDYTENFRDFLEAKPGGEPFCFWFGAHEPHRPYEFMAGISRGGKNLEDLQSGMDPGGDSPVFRFWPDTDSVRIDLLDYAYEIEYFDSHIGRMIEMLEERDELDNTLIVITADNGMPFPRIKGQAYELSNHLPLVMGWRDGIEKPGRKIPDFVNFIDFAPTFLELAGITETESGMKPVTGTSMTDLFYQRENGESARNYVLIGKERHDVGRPEDRGYPIRGIISGDYLYIMNFETGRWPSGNPETGYLNCDGSPTKTVILNLQRNRDTRDLPFWDLCFGKRPREELYLRDSDPECLQNLADKPEFLDLRDSLYREMSARLAEQGDPRFNGDPDIFDRYTYAHESGQNYYKRFFAGEADTADWVNPTDYEPEPFKK